ncbi:MAG: energy-coupling factor transporter ATPase [Oscillospiraceae bacterium]|nr:energy-coupling factor transporter ATPase [Oscillospiraceae bacterium]
MNSIIDFENVTFRYDEQEENSKEVLRNINLSVEKGSFVAVLGHNGSGKSTLAKLTNAILVPQEGKVLVEGIDTADEDRKNDIRRKVGMVFQNPDNQIVATMVEDDVAFGPENLGVDPKEIRRRVDESLKAVGMFDYRLHEPHKLSGGQKQRVAIAGVIAMQTDCIVLDEPTAMLDPRGRKEVMDTVKRLNRDMGITIIFITHYMDEAVQADRVIVIDDGRIRYDGTPGNVFRHIKEIKKIGLDVPQATELSYLLKNDGIDLGDVLTADEFVSAFEKLRR